MDAKGTTTYNWDYENRLKSVVLPGSGGTVNFKYDPFGRRIQKSSSSGTTNYVYDGANALEEVDTAGNVVARYVQGPGIDEPLAQTRSGTTSYYQADGLGSVTSLSNSSGALANTYTYDSFGRLTASSGTVVNPYQYTARDYDGETGLRYYRARYYESNTARFSTQDPIGFNGGSNFYRYSGNDPANKRDPLGLYAGADDAIFTVGGLIVGVGAQAFADLLAGHFSSWQGYTGAAIGGAVGGELLLYAGPVAAGAIGGAAGNITTQVLNHYTLGCDYSLPTFAASTGLGALTGLFPGLPIPGVTQGRNSLNAIFKQMVTKLGNGSISSVTAGTAVQMFAGRAAATGLVPGAFGQAIAQTAPTSLTNTPCGCN